MTTFKDLFPANATAKSPKTIDTDKQSRRDGAVPAVRCKLCYSFNDYSNAQCWFCESLNWK